MSTLAANRSEQGSVYVEYLVVLVPFLVFAFSLLELLEVWTAEVLMRRAASAAVRAAAVVLPDDPRFYDNLPVHRYEGARKAAVELAASLVLVPTPEFQELLGVDLELPTESPMLTATVRASFDCPFGFATVVCPTGKRVLSARARFPYQGARYAYSRTRS